MAVRPVIVERTSPRMGRIVVAAFLGLCVVCSRSTWRVPAEWRSLSQAAQQVQEHVPRSALVVAPEALLFAADRRGCRVEYTAASARRAAGEWGDSAANDVDGPLALIAFYQRHGAEFFADVVPSDPDPRRLALHESVRRRYNVVVDRPGVLIASLKVPTAVETQPIEIVNVAVRGAQLLRKFGRSSGERIQEENRRNLSADEKD